MGISKIKKIEQAITNYLQEAMNGKTYVEGNKHLTNATMIGHGISHYITEILQERKESKIKGRWIDDISWNNLEFFPPNKMRGRGKLWWGFKNDMETKTYSEDFNCEIDWIDSEKMVISYLFEFEIDGKIFKLKK